MEVNTLPGTSMPFGSEYGLQPQLPHENLWISLRFVQPNAVTRYLNPTSVYFPPSTTHRYVYLFFSPETKDYENCVLNDKTRYLLTTYESVDTFNYARATFKSSEKTKQ